MTYEVTDRAERENALALYTAAQELQDKFDAMEEPEHTPEVQAKLDELWSALRREQQEARDRYDEKQKEILAAAPNQDGERAAIEAQLEAAWAAYDGAAGPAVMIEDDQPVRCIITGVPLWEDDEVFEDPETGEKALRAAIGLPPRPALAEETEEDEEREPA